MTRPPKYAIKLLRFICHPEQVEFIEGDLAEMFFATLQEKGHRKAVFLYWFTVFSSVRLYQFKERFHPKFSVSMTVNHIKLAWRNVLKHKVSTLVNLVGLVLTFASCLLIFLFIRFENSYDSFHNDSERIYRIGKNFVNDTGIVVPDATTQSALAPALKQELIEVEEAVRIEPIREKVLVVYGDKIFYETNLFSADPEFFNVFTYQFLEGEPSLALIDDKSLVITESIRKKYFGELAAIGKILRYNGEDRLISAVVEDPPINSHFHFNIICKLISPSYNLNSLDTDWNGYNWYTYLKLKPKTDVTEFEKKLQGLIERNKVVLKANYFIQHLTDIHLHSNLKSELETNGSFSFNRILVYVGGFLLLVGIVNFINLSVVRVLFRAKEYGISKISGATNSTLFFNFLSESFVLVFVSFNIAIILIYLILSSFNNQFGMMLSLNELNDSFIAMICVISLLIIGALSAAFPVLYFARLNLVKILKAGFNSSNHGVWLRKALVVFQFVVTAVMISGNVIIYRQMDFLKNHDLGFDKEQILILPGISEDIHGDVVKEKFFQLPEVKKIAFASSLPGDQNMFFMAAAKGSSQNTIMDYAFVDYDYIDLLDLKIIQGRNFSREYLSDETDFPLIINETAARILGLDGNAVGAEITPNPKAIKPIYFKIIGVIKDFHFTTFHEEIKPFMLSLSPQGPNLILKLSTDKYSATLDKLENIWKENIKDIPFDYRFLDDSFYKKYKAEEDLQIFFIGLTLVTMLIASSGLFAIATILINKRKLEIAIRKVMGASTKNVYRLIGQEYVNLVSLSVLLSVPIAFILMKTWLENFVYRIDINIVDFVIVAFISVTLCLLIVSYQAVKIAIMDPLKTLRSE